MTNQSDLYRAVLKNGVGVITVIAEGPMDAASKIETELHKNVNRVALWDKWVKDGMIIKKSY